MFRTESCVPVHSGLAAAASSLALGRHGNHRARVSLTPACRERRRVVTCPRSREHLGAESARASHAAEDVPHVVGPRLQPRRSELSGLWREPANRRREKLLLASVSMSDSGAGEPLLREPPVRRSLEAARKEQTMNCCTTNWVFAATGLAAMLALPASARDLERLPARDAGPDAKQHRPLHRLRGACGRRHRVGGHGSRHLPLRHTHVDL